MPNYFVSANRAAATRLERRWPNIFGPSYKDELDSSIARDIERLKPEVILEASFVLPAYVVIAIFEDICAALNWRFFASGFVISAERPK